jgi:hypothetical protein
VVFVPPKSKHAQLQIAEKDDLGVTTTLLSDKEVDLITSLQGGVAPLTVPHPLLSPPGGHPVAKYFRDNARKRLATRLAKQHPRVVAIGGNALHLHKLGLPIWTCSPRYTEKDAVKHAKWKRDGIPFCTCDAEKFLSNPCPKCRPFAQRDTAIMLVDVIYYIQKELPELQARFAEVASYHHLFKGRSGRILRAPHAECRWFKRDDKVYFSALGDGQVHSHPDNKWLERFTALSWAEYGEAGVIATIIPRRNELSVDEFEKALSSIESGQQEEKWVEEAACRAANTRTPSLVGTTAANAVTSVATRDGKAIPFKKVVELSEKAARLVTNTKVATAPVAAETVAIAEQYNAARLGKPVTEQAIRKAGRAQRAVRQQFTKLRWSKWQWFLHDYGLLATCLLVLAAGVVFTFSTADWTPRSVEGSWRWLVTFMESFVWPLVSRLWQRLLVRWGIPSLLAAACTSLWALRPR